MTAAMAHSYPFASTQKRRSQVNYPILDEYRRHLEMDRGIVDFRVFLAANTCLLDFLESRGKAVEAISKRDIDDFVTEQGRYYQKQTIAGLAGFLRSFLRFLLSRGVVDVDWAAAVPKPRLFKGKRDPRYLRPEDVQRVLALVDRTRLIGKRDYAILVLLGIYGMRGAEVAQLTLDDIRWQSMTLRLRHRKCADSLELPLVPAAATALADYILARGESGHREVFLSSRRPFGALTVTTLRDMARKAILHASIEVAHPGSHSFRYATAQALFQAERPVSEIATVLGHRDLHSTIGYLSFAIHPLREVALNDGEDLA